MSAMEIESQPAPKKEEAQLIIEEDEEFEEFELYKNKEEINQEALKEWEEEWEDDVIEDDFAATLRNELKTQN
ncbi:unnamed protein product [Blepharisma stoltei]|uniref:Protein DELETION OF SUV3 SUPPRESSOR 1(I)-like n=1 Tax=Blepharisma stoltei TaxID=1481888 RepID=A0AAU9KAM9_9CILI|nr:unnamed protein product [Blepharisma stoltei]